ncbi:MAG: insulinase family protein [Candidatus Brocadiae bacterium]|nr:insulinase family protein [Candidatus Brocadiia bacterium]
MKKLLPPIEVIEEPDGATLLCLSRRDVPACAAWVSCPGGRRLEPPGRAALGLLSAALFGEGPAGIDPLDWRRQLEREAVSVGVHCRAQEWEASWGCLSEDVEVAQGFLLRLLGQPGLHRGRWKRLVKGRRASARETFAQPIGVIGQLPYVQSLGRRHPYARAHHEKAIARVRYRDAAAMARSAFRRRGPICAAVGGDVAPEDGIRLARDLVAVIAAGGDPLPPEPSPAPSRAPVWLMDHPKVTQAFVALSRPGVRAGDPDRVALRLAMRIIGGGLTSRLGERVRVEMGHTYGISAHLPEERMLTPFVIQTFTQVEKLTEMLSLIDQILREVVDEGFTREEVDAAGDYLHGSLPLHLTSPRAVLRYVERGLRAGLSVDALEDDWQAIRSTPLSAVNEAARRLIGDVEFRLAVIGPAREVRPQIEGRGEIARFPFRASPDRWPD